MDPCPRCGRPMERIDDFWYCDNPGCSRRRDLREAPRPLSEDEIAALEARLRAGGTPTPGEVERLVFDVRRLRAELARLTAKPVEEDPADIE